MTNTKVYIHEFIDIIGHHRADYLHHMTAHWSPLAREERQQLCYGVWGTVGSTGRWPQVVNVWEEDGWDGLATSFAHEFSHPTLQDPTLAAWWAKAATFRRGGVDRLLVPAPWTRTIDELCAAGVTGEVYAHETYRVNPGRAWYLTDLIRTEAIPLLGRFGWELAGTWVTALRGDDEVIVLWAIPTWAQWAAFEAAAADDGEVDAWRDRLVQLTTSWERILLADAPLSPFRTGRQPEIADQANPPPPDDPAAAPPRRSDG